MNTLKLKKTAFFRTPLSNLKTKCHLSFYHLPFRLLLTFKILFLLPLLSTATWAAPSKMEPLTEKHIHMQRLSTLLHDKGRFFADARSLDNKNSIRQKRSAPLKTTPSVPPETTPSPSVEKNINMAMSSILMKDKNRLFLATKSFDNWHSTEEYLHIYARSLGTGILDDNFGDEGIVTLKSIKHMGWGSVLRKGDQLLVTLTGCITGDKSPHSNCNRGIIVISLDSKTGTFNKNFGKNGIATIEHAEGSDQYIFLGDVSLNKENLLITVNSFPGGYLKVYGINPNTGILNEDFGQSGAVSLSNDQAGSYSLHTSLIDDHLYVAASFHDGPNSIKKETSDIRICGINTTTGNFEEPFNCLHENAFSIEGLGFRNYVRAITPVNDDKGLLLTVDVNGTPKLYEKNAVFAYFINRQTNTLEKSFGDNGILKLTGTNSRYAALPTKVNDNQLLFTIERLEDNNKKLIGQSPKQGLKEVLIDSVNSIDGQFNKHFGNSGRLSLTGSKLRDIVTRDILLDSRRSRLLVFLNKWNKVELAPSHSVDTMDIEIHSINLISGLSESGFGNGDGVTVLSGSKDENYIADTASLGCGGHMFIFGDTIKTPLAKYDANWLPKVFSLRANGIKDPLFQFD